MAAGGEQRVKGETSPWMMEERGEEDRFVLGRRARNRIQKDKWAVKVRQLLLQKRKESTCHFLLIEKIAIVLQTSSDSEVGT